MCLQCVCCVSHTSTSRQTVCLNLAWRSISCGASPTRPASSPPRPYLCATHTHTHARRITLHTTDTSRTQHITYTHKHRQHTRFPCGHAHTLTLRLCYAAHLACPAAVLVAAVATLVPAPHVCARAPLDRHARPAARIGGARSDHCGPKSGRTCAARKCKGGCVDRWADSV